MKVRPYRKSDGRASNVLAELRRKVPPTDAKFYPYEDGGGRVRDVLAGLLTRIPSDTSNGLAL